MKRFSGILIGSSILISMLVTPSQAAMTVSSPAPMGGTFFSVAVPKSVLNSTLFGTDGKPFNLNIFKGKYLVLSPFLTTCQEICPMVSANMLSIAKAVNKAGLANQVKVIEVSVDPGRDTAERIKAYQNLFGDNSWLMASGTEANLKTFWKFFGAQATKMPYSAKEMKELPVDWQSGKKNTYDVMHTDEVLIISPDQKWVWLDLGSPAIGKGSIPPKLKSFLNAQGIANLAKPEEPSWNVTAVTAALSQLIGKKIS